MNSYELTLIGLGVVVVGLVAYRMLRTLKAGQQRTNADMPATPR